MNIVSLLLLISMGSLGCVLGGCPFAHTPSIQAPTLDSSFNRVLLQNEVNIKAMEKLDLKAVKADLKKLMTDSKPFWPADDGHYGGLMIRLAWHCSGSYRKWDGRGGCNGGRIRFNPELSWDDNTNLDKARKLLEPIKAKYGDALTWGDLIVLSGTVAIESMGGPNIGVCLGRIDDMDGRASLPLGPTKEQEAIAPCKTGDGMCQQPLGQTTMGLIYVNPEGVLGEPVPEKSVAQIRQTFGQMGMDDRETVALIGGGHAFGKAHGACPTGAGPGPKQNPSSPWPGTCGSGDMKGRGPNTFTSGFEGSWTTTPSSWSNEYFKNLLEFDWEKHKGPGNHWQWKPKHKAGSAKASEPLPNIMMLTADIALLKDPEYLKLVKMYAADQDALTKDFGEVWYKLMTRGQGPWTRCIGPDVPSARAFQLPLPAPSDKQPNWPQVRADILKAMAAKPENAANFAALAYACASTYRATDFAGGCNGARIRFSPQKDFPDNKGLVDTAIKALQPVKDAHKDLTWADLIVLAGTIAVEQGAGLSPKAGQLVASPFSFCPGRTDASEGGNTEHLAPRTYGDNVVAFRDNAAVAGLSLPEAVALVARPMSAASRSGVQAKGPTLSNAYFKTLVDSAASKTAMESSRQGSAAEAAIRADAELTAMARGYASNNDKFIQSFAGAWTKLMNADRFKGPVGNVCAST